MSHVMNVLGYQDVDDWERAIMLRPALLAKDEAIERKDLSEQVMAMMRLGGDVIDQEIKNVVSFFDQGQLTESEFKVFVRAKFGSR